MANLSVVPATEADLHKIVSTLNRAIEYLNRGQFVGRTVAATAGNVGEHITATLGAGSATALTDGVAKTVTSIPLTPGDWDVTATGIISGNAATVLGHLYASISAVDNTLNLTEGRYSNQVPRANAFATSGLTPTANVGPFQFLLTTTTTLYLVLLAGFTVNTCSGYGNIHARRV